MRCDLSEADATKLVDGFRRRRAPARPAIDLRILALDLGVDAAGLESALGERRRAETSFVEEVLDAAKGESERLAPLVGAVAGKPALPPKDHTWVQVQDAATKAWVDLDTLDLPHPGARPVTSQQLEARSDSKPLKAFREGESTSINDYRSL